jgi:hypothetical protein
MPIGVLSLYMQFPGSMSLKEKRSRIKPLVARLHREFNVSAAEMDRLDAWDETVIACALISNDAAQAQRVLQHIVTWVEQNWPDASVLSDQIELI